MKVRSRAPLRLGICGGGTDVSPYCDEHGGLVLNATIDKYAYCTLDTDADDVKFEATDLQISEAYSVSDFPNSSKQLKLHHAVYLYMIEKYNNGKLIPLKMTTSCDAPIGSGLGSSSTLVVAMIKAFDHLFKAALDDYGIAREAFFVERVICGLNGGCQDQYAAAFGGFNLLDCRCGGNVIVNPLRISKEVLLELESSIVLYFTGVSRESAKIIDEQKKNVVDSNKEALAALDNLKKETRIMKDALLLGNFDCIVDSINRSWESKKKSASVISNEVINHAMNVAFNAGAKAGKVSGAGGGGFMLFIVQNEIRDRVLRELKALGGLTTTCHFTKSGVTSWEVRKGSKNEEFYARNFAKFC